MSTPPTAPGRRAAQKAAQAAALEARKADSARRLRRYRWPALAIVALLVVIVGIVLLRGGDDSSGSAAVSGRSQSTVLIQLVPQVGSATVGNALTAADERAGKGVFMALPGRLITAVPGRGSTTLDQTPVIADGAAAGNALSDQLDVLVDGSWVMTGPSLAALIDKVGGVTVDVDVTVPGSVPVPAGNAQRLTGAQAVAYATFLGPRETEATRLARFTEVWRATLGALPADVEATRNLIAGNAGSVSTLSPDALAGYLVTLRDAVLAESVAYPTLPTVVVDTGSGPVTYRLDEPKVPAVIKAEFAGSLPAVRPGGPVTVLVQNGVGTPGLVEKARTKLKAAGLTFESGGNASKFGYATSLILVPDDTVESQAQARETAKALGLPDSAIQRSEQGQSAADVLVILGKDFRG